MHLPLPPVPLPPRKSFESPWFLGRGCRNAPAAIFAGPYHSAALTKSGALFVWGDGQDGQLGINQRCTQSSRPYLVGIRFRWLLDAMHGCCWLKSLSLSWWVGRLLRCAGPQ